jgi:hypothetical protein
MLVVEEARFHLLFRLTVWDITQLRLIAVLLTQHPHS